MGKSMRATAENPVLARINGIDTRQVIRWTWIIGTGFATTAGALQGHIIQLKPEMGFDLLLPMFAALILGGVGNIYGTVLGAILVGLIDSLSVAIGLSSYRAAVVFHVHYDRLVGSATGAVGGENLMDFLSLVSFLTFFLIFASLYSVTCLGLNMQWGFTGLFNVGVVGFFAVGAYASAILTGPNYPDTFLGGFRAPRHCRLCGCGRCGRPGWFSWSASLPCACARISSPSPRLALPLRFSLLLSTSRVLTRGPDGLYSLP